MSNDTTGMLKTSKRNYVVCSDFTPAYERGGIYSLAPSVMARNFGERRPSRIQKVASFFDFDRLNPSGDCYICKDWATSSGFTVIQFRWDPKDKAGQSVIHLGNN